MDLSNTTEVSEGCTYRGAFFQQDREDAYSWVLHHGSLGSLANSPTLEYLLGLKQYLAEWSARVDFEIQRTKE
jgi:hypothetical protein